MKKYLLLVPAYIFVGLSVLHTLVAFIQFKAITEQALWFFSAGMALFSCGALNLILQRNPDDLQIRRLAVITNFVMTIFVIVFGAFTMKRNLVNPLAWLLILNALAAMVLSIRKPRSTF